MSEYTERFERVTAGFTARVEAVPDDRWESVAPCEGWVARDVVRHLVEWVPGFFEAFAGRTLEAGPSVDEDPAGAWAALRDQLAGWLADPTIASGEIDGPMGRMPMEEVIDRFVTGDVLVHTWDLARATGLDEALDADAVHGMYEGILPMDEVLRQGTHFGPKVEVPDDADEQTKLLAFVGRHP